VQCGLSEPYARLFREHVELSQIYDIVFIILVNYVVNSEYLAKHLIVFGKKACCKKRTKMLLQ